MDSSSPSRPPQEAESALTVVSSDNMLPDGAAESAFFQHLPFDIRRLILVQAFGDRTVHVDYPDEERQLLYQRSHTMNRLYIISDFFLSITSHLRAVPSEQLKWYGFVCDQTSVSASQAKRKRHKTCPRRWRMDRMAQEKDYCVHEYVQLKDAARERARIGAVGWLRSCRRAHTEGIEILYATNSFHIIAAKQPTSDIQNPGTSLPLLLPSERHLGLITSLQLSWDLGSVARPPPKAVLLLEDPRFAGWRTFTSLLSGLPSTFPHLRSLYLSLDGEWFPQQMAPNDILRRFETDLLAPIDEMVETILLGSHRKKFGEHDDEDDGDASCLSSCEIVVAIPSPFRFVSSTTLLPAIKNAADQGDEGGDSDSDSDEAQCSSVGHVWRSLLPVSHLASGQGREGQQKDDRGYWVTRIADEIKDQRLFQVMPKLLQIISQKGALANNSR